MESHRKLEGLTSRLNQESRALGLMGIEELRKICHEETERARQLRTDDLYARNKEEPSTMNQVLSQIWICKTRWTPWMKKNNFTIQRQRAVLECSTFPVTVNLENSEPQRHALPRFWIASIYTEFDGYFWKCFWKPISSRKNLSVPYQGLPWDMEKDCDENRKVQQYRLHDFPGILMPGILDIVLEELISKLYDGNAELCYHGTAFRKIPRTRCLSERQLQDRSVRKHIYSWTHYVMDPWSGDG